MNYNELEFRANIEKDSGYGTKTIRRRMRLDRFIGHIIRHKVYGAISARVGSWPFRNYIPIIDCDSTDSLLTATHWITKYMGSKYAAIQSSPDRYWLILDHADSFHRAFDVAREVPGNDAEYRHYTWRIGVFVIRATPKVCKNGNIYTPLFPESHELTNPVVIEWYNAVKRYFGSQEYNRLKMHEALTLAAKNGAGAMAADPNFVV